MHLIDFLSIHRSKVTLAGFWRLLGSRDAQIEETRIAYRLEPSSIEGSEAIAAIEKNQEEVKVYLNTPSLTGPQSVLPEYFQNSIVDGFSRGDHRLRRFLHFLTIECLD